MEYTKNTERFSFGFGRTKVAGTGKLSDSRRITAKLSAKAVAGKAVTAGLQAMAVATVSGLKVKFSGK
ncbi:MAG: hypothetical protein K2K02_07770 [Ruminococcus sp.]|nr:hypothetical protein [Ruminococcus sp.]